MKDGKILWTVADAIGEIDDACRTAKQLAALSEHEGLTNNQLDTLGNAVDLLANYAELLKEIPLK